MKKNWRLHDALDFITLKTNTMKTDANICLLYNMSTIFRKEFLFLTHFLTLFLFCNYIFTLLRLSHINAASTLQCCADGFIKLRIRA